MTARGSEIPLETLHSFQSSLRSHFRWTEENLQCTDVSGVPGDQDRFQGFQAWEPEFRQLLQRFGVESEIQRSSVIEIDRERLDEGVSVPFLPTTPTTTTTPTSRRFR